MPLVDDPWQPRDSMGEYYAYRYPTTFRLLNYVLCPITCGCFWCWCAPKEHPYTGVAWVDLPPLDERMSDIHFMRKARKLNHRRNRLSLGQPTGTWARLSRKGKQPSNQSNSPLFSKLPYEIRSEIFKMALCDTGAILILTHYGNQSPGRFQRIGAMVCELAIDKPINVNGVIKVGAGSIAKDSTIGIALLRTCRLIYSEALPMLYGQTQFVFDNPRDLITFSRSIPQTHFKAIRSIRLEYTSNSRSRHIANTLRQYVDPSKRLGKGSLVILRSMPHLRSLYLVFRLWPDERLLRRATEQMLEIVQEYVEKTLEATTTQCKVDLMIYHYAKLQYRRTEQGLIEIC